jgi:hypothetical protein
VSPAWAMRPCHPRTTGVIAGIMKVVISATSAHRRFGQSPTDIKDCQFPFTFGYSLEGMSAEQNGEWAGSLPG